MPNAASVALHERMGFKHTGTFPGVGHKDDAWLDVGWWQLELQPETKNPPDLQSFASIRDSPLVTAALDEGRQSANR